MDCKCKYFRKNEKGELVCSQCGQPAHSSKIEDKIVEQHEDKQIWPPESKRLSKVVKKNRGR